MNPEQIIFAKKVFESHKWNNIAIVPDSENDNINPCFSGGPVDPFFYFRGHEKDITDLVEVVDQKLLTEGRDG